MFFNQISLHGSRTYSLFHHSPVHKLKPYHISLKHTQNFQKYIDGYWSRLRLACFNTNAVSHSFDEFSIEENVGKSKGGGAFLHRMENRGILANQQTFVWLLDRCLNSGSIEEGKKVHGKILTMGFSTEHFLSEKLMDFYIALGDLDGAINVFDNMPKRNIFSWNKIISAFLSKKINKVLEFYSRMVAEYVNPNERTFAGILKACSGSDFTLEYVEQIHARIIHHGVDFSPFACNPLIDLYVKNGCIDSAKKVFDKLYVKDSVSWMAMISGLSQNGHAKQAILLFNEMHILGIFPTPYAFSSVLSACTKIEFFKLGKLLHSLVHKLGFSYETYVCNALIALYSRSGSLVSAERIFSNMQLRDGATYNSLIYGLAQSGYGDRALELFEKMQHDCLKPDCVTVASLLGACTSLEVLVPNEFTYSSTSVGALDLGEKIHSQVIKTGLHYNVYVCSVLIDMYGKLGKLETALEILRRLPEVDVVSWTAIIARYIQHDLFDEALKLFREMLNQGIQSDNIGLSSAISACARTQLLSQGRQIHAQSFLSGFSDNLSITNSLISLYAGCGQRQDAYTAFKKIVNKDYMSWNALISGLAQAGFYEEALQVFSQMHTEAVEANSYSFISSLSAAANTANITQGKQIHSSILKTGYDLEIEVSNVLITFYAKCGNIDDARKEFLEMPEKNEGSWNAMITGYSQHGYGIEAIYLFEKMKEDGVSPNHVSFVGVLSACSHLGLVDDGLGYFDSMEKEHGIVPKPEHYACVVDLLGRAGLLDRARQFVEDMPIEPDAIIWRTLLSACAVHKNIDIGEFAAHHLLKFEPQDSASYFLLSNLYAVSKKWDSRGRTRQMMIESGVKKEPAQSWIEVNNSIHSFFVGDRHHPLAEEIYEHLEYLNKRAAETGYVHNRYSLFSDAEQCLKDPNVLIHSEKLAIAFGLLSLPGGIPVHVINNLRVCNDCHNWIKVVSKISKRMIILRDAYQFHHFRNGYCSCRDHW